MSDESALRPIATNYNGYRFRSRLEARWAVFLDALKVPYVFEPEGYELELGGGTRYLPDFWLPTIECFLEIKPELPSEKEIDKGRALAVASGHTLYIFFGPPTPPRERHARPDEETVAGSVVCRPNGNISDAYVWMQHPRTFTDMSHDRRRYHIELAYDDEVRYDRDVDLARTDRLLDAYTAARSHRFDGRW